MQITRSAVRQRRDTRNYFVEWKKEPTAKVKTSRRLILFLHSSLLKRLKAWRSLLFQYSNISIPAYEKKNIADSIGDRNRLGQKNLKEGFHFNFKLPKRDTCHMLTVLYSTWWPHAASGVKGVAKKFNVLTTLYLLSSNAIWRPKCQ